MSKKLEDIRRKIDTLDNSVHDLLMERAALVSDIAAEKVKNKMQVVQPAREAVMLRRLLARHKGPLPEATIVQIWRELVGAVSLLQTGLSVVVAGSEKEPVYWDMARNYFGSVLPMKKIASPLAAVAAVRDDDAYFAVMPWPDDTDATPWWPFIAGQDSEKIRIICALPFGSDEAAPQTRALVISKLEFLESGDDRSFITMELASGVSRARIVDALRDLKIEPLSLYTQVNPAAAMSVHLVEVQNVIQNNDPALSQIKEKFGDSCMRCVALGGYPATPVFKKMHKEAIPAAPSVKQEDKKKAKQV